MHPRLSSCVGLGDHETRARVSGVGLRMGQHGFAILSGAAHSATWKSGWCDGPPPRPLHRAKGATWPSPCRYGAWCKATADAADVGDGRCRGHGEAVRIAHADQGHALVQPRPIEPPSAIHVDAAARIGHMLDGIDGQNALRPTQTGFVGLMLKFSTSLPDRAEFQQ